MTIQINPTPFKTRLYEVIQQTLKPPPKLKLSEWADTYRVLSSEAAAEPGKWYTSRAEYQREILDVISDPTTELIVLMMGAQLGKSEALLNILGYFIHNDPSPILLVQHSVDEARSFSTTRIAPLLRDTPALRNLASEAKSRDTANTILRKTFVGGSLSLVGANAPAGLASKPIRVLLCDEVDRYPLSAGTEGSPVDLAIKRTTTFFNKKIVLCSTPGSKETSEIYRRYLQTDQREYQIQCVHCEHFFIPKFFEHVKWQKDEAEHFIYGTTMLYCPECGSGHTDAQRNHAVRKGRWIKNNPGAAHAGFKTSQLVSPFVKLDNVVRDEWIPAIGNPQKQRVFFNTVLSEPFEEQMEGLDNVHLIERVEAYNGLTIPVGAAYLTAGADVQKDRIEFSVYGWGEDFESWHIHHEIIYGDPKMQSTWEDLKTALLTKYKRADGYTLGISAACIDSGHLARQVIEFCEANRQRKWYAIKGMPGPAVPIWNRGRKSGTGKGTFYPVGTHQAKDMIYAWLANETPGPGYMHFSNTVTPEFFTQLTAEKKVLRQDKSGRNYHYWFCPSGARNEALDCAVYALAARDSLKYRAKTVLRKQADALQRKQEAEATSTPAAPSEATVGLANAQQSPVLQPANVQPKVPPELPAWKRKLLARQQGRRFV